MNDSQLLDRLATTDTYRPDVPLPESLRSDIVLHEIERRMDMDMDMKELTQPPTTPKRRWNGMVAAAVAFVAVVIVGVVVALSSLGGGDEIDPATTIPSTTEVAPPTSEPGTTTTTVAASSEVSVDDLALAASFVDAMNSEEPGGWESMFAAPVIEIPAFGGGWTIAVGSDDELPEHVDLAERAELGECTQAGNRVSCQIYHANLFTETVGIDPFWDRWSFVPQGGLVAEVRWQHDAGNRALYRFELAVFQAWVDEHHPEAGVLIASPGTLEDWVIGLTEEQRAMIPDLIAEYADSLG